MARKLVRISLATKFRVLFAAAALAIIAVALAVPLYFTERLMEEATEQSASQVDRLYLQEWLERHQRDPRPDSALARFFTAEGGGRRGPTLLSLLPGRTAEPLDASAHRAVRSFREEPARKTALLPEENEEGRKVYRYFRAVRAGATCRNCHDGVHGPPFQGDQLVAAVDLTLPAPRGSLIWWTRGAFLLGGALAALLAFVAFYVITKQTVLRPIRHLRALSDQVTEGDLSARSDIATGDEFERLGRSFNEMLEALQFQQEQLRQANRALDLRLGELAEANVALYEANRIKNEFLANVSHELRTPLNSIIGFAELLAETDDERRRRHAHHILTSARMLLGIINDLLEVVKIEAGKAEVHNEKVSVTDLCETLAQLVRPLADKKHLQLQVAFADGLPVVRTDPRKMQQILYNLLSNAIKFTPPDGQVMLSARHLPAGESPLQREAVAVAVADTGPGIPAADQGRIFEKFSRLDEAMTRQHAGAGLGLAISKDLTSLLGGRLTLDSEPGHGATFTVILPVHPATERPGSPAGANN